MYFGFKTLLTFALWITFAVCIVVGPIFLGLGLSGYLDCKWCKNEQGARLLGLSNGSMSGDKYVRCQASRNSYLTWHPDQLTDADVQDQYFSWCINNGALASLIAGAVVTGFGLLLLIGFVFAPPPVEEAPRWQESHEAADPAPKEQNMQGVQKAWDAASEKSAAPVPMPGFKSTTSPLFVASPGQTIGVGAAGNPMGTVATGHATAPWQGAMHQNAMHHNGAALNQLQQNGAAGNQTGPRVMYLGGRPVGSDMALGYSQAPYLGQPGMMNAQQLNGPAQMMQQQMPVQQNLAAMQQPYPLPQQGMMQGMQPMAMNSAYR